MTFKLLPVLDKMEELYLLPRTPKRFESYLKLLQGTKGKDLVLPIAGYNPMGSEQVLLKLKELKALDAEGIVERELQTINDNYTSGKVRTIEVAINLADDIGGLWSNFSTTDYSNKFEFGALLKRNFCTPYFWTSESYSESVILERIKSTVFRTIYWATHTEPFTLKDCLEQEVFVQTQMEVESNLKNDKLEDTERFYLKYSKSEDYDVKFNFFYGDEASQELGYATYGRKSLEGFKYAQYLGSHRNIFKK